VEVAAAMVEQRHPFDIFFDEHGYKDGDEPQAFADWLASQTGEKVVGISEDGAVEGHPEAARA
jgi:hypothetical protein